MNLFFEHFIHKCYFNFFREDKDIIAVYLLLIGLNCIMQIHVVISEGFSPETILLELYQDTFEAGSLTINVDDDGDAQFESEVEDLWVETYLWEFWVSLVNLRQSAISG
jgi:hypothetical protein